MSKKKTEEVGAPKVTNLPLPISDTPLVIDLPDGQKIVIGKMQAGSVIEVATWRGTGRPDSRTNRLMMGMNSGAPAPSVENAPVSNSNKASTPTSNKWQDKVLASFKSFVVLAQLTVKKLISQLKDRKPVATKIQAADTQSASALSSASEVDDWLQKVLERSEKKAAKADKATPKPAKSASSMRKKTPAKKTKN